MLRDPLYGRMIAGRIGTIFDNFLPQAIARLPGDIRRIADCGAGVGYTAQSYADALRQALGPNPDPAAGVTAYEPLPENIAQFRNTTAHDPLIRLRPVAVAETAGQATFTVPLRLDAPDNTVWTPGTSYGGYLGNGRGETITVDVVRLGDELGYDVIKLDLQGGELAALRGLGPGIGAVKVIYAETQLLDPSGTITFLRAQGFVCFLDRLQFGFGPVASFDPGVLAGLGLHISTLYLPGSSGMPLRCRGYFDLATDCIDEATGELVPGLSQKLRGLGLTYLQTDVLAIHAAQAGALIPLI